MTRPLTFRRWVRSALVLCAPLALFMPGSTRADDAAARRPIVVELFTSQGCSSCPPADALLRDLAKRQDVLALGFHVDYWNGLGWKDPLSTPAATERQQAYGRMFELNTIYTPQIVVDGQQQMVGSDRIAVLSAIASVKPDAAIRIGFAPDRRNVLLSTSPSAESAASGSGNVVTLLRFVRERLTDVSRGENSGRELRDANGVISLRRLGTWSGATETFAIDPPGGDEGIAVLVQAADGRILGAAAALGR